MTIFKVNYLNSLMIYYAYFRSPAMSIMCSIILFLLIGSYLAKENYQGSDVQLGVEEETRSSGPLFGVSQNTL